MQIKSLLVNSIHSFLQKVFGFVICLFVCLFVCFVALRPKSTAMVMAVQSVDLTTPFPGQA